MQAILSSICLTQQTQKRKVKNGFDEEFEGGGTVFGYHSASHTLTHFFRWFSCFVIFGIPLHPCARKAVTIAHDMGLI